MRKFTAMIAAGLIMLSHSTVMAATYSALISSDNQVAAAANTPYTVKMTGDATPGYKVDGSKVTILKPGDYFVIGAAQVGGSTPGNIYLWVRVNGKDVPDSNSIQYIPSAQFTTVLVSQGEMTFKANDVLEFVYAASAPGLGLIASKPAGMPAVPSIIFTIYKN
jgi:archaellum component FlaF (FlaF/FlaG flagellin family)